MIGTIAVILVLGGLIFFHELGHFFTARLFGMGVKTFSLGFGPALFSYKKGQTVYQLAAVPLGGFVSLVGESAEAEIPDGFTEKDSFSLRPAWQRFCVILAGPVANILLAWLICWGALWLHGRDSLPPVVGEIVTESPAAASPLQPGDRITSIDGEPIDRFAQMPAMINKSQGKAILVTAQRPDETLISFSITPVLQQHEIDGKIIESWGMGIHSTKPVNQSFGFVEAAYEGVIEAKAMVTDTWQALTSLIARKVSFSNVGGPILIAQAVYKQTERGITGVFLLAALISVNLGVLNLLPIPVLDGGHLVFLLVEMVGRRPVPVRIQERAMMVGLVLLLTLMVAATFNDVMRLLS